MLWSRNKKEVFDVVDPRGEEGHCFISGKVGITGEVHFAGTLRIDGRIDGKVAVYEGKKGTLIISKGAMVNGPVVATDLITDGAINGDVDVEGRLECRANAVIKGEVVYQSISIADGARLEGRCQSRKPKVEKIVPPTSDDTPSRPTSLLATRDTSFLKKA